MQPSFDTPLPRDAGEDIDPEQSWFYSEAWLRGERNASQQVANGQTSFYDDEDALERAFRERDQRITPAD